LKVERAWEIITDHPYTYQIIHNNTPLKASLYGSGIRDNWGSIGGALGENWGSKGRG
jgi:hypothetical protein